MRVMAQMAMVMNLDKCIGCHTCSVTCKQAWTNRTGTEYVWFNNVETRPGQGYPRTYEDQERWQGGWTLNRRGRLTLRGGGRLRKLLTIFSNPKMPSIDDYYEPWTYDYETLTNAPLQEHTPVARPKSLISGDDMAIRWSANWDDNLGGRPGAGPATRYCGDASPTRSGSSSSRPSCSTCRASASTASTRRARRRALRRDLQAQRGRHRARRPGPLPRLADVRHRLPVQEDLLQPPHRQGREVHVLLPARRGRDPDGVLGDVRGPAALHRARPLRRGPGARGGVHDGRAPTSTARSGRCSSTRTTLRSIEAAERAGIPRDWIDAAQRSPVWALINRFEVALPLHPEYRTMPMVWYIPPLSPVVDVVRETGEDAEAAGNLFGAIERCAAGRVPRRAVHGGRPGAVNAVLRRLAAMRSYIAAPTSAANLDDTIPASVGMNGEAVDDMYRLLAIAKYDERYVIHRDAGLAHATR